MQPNPMITVSLCIKVLLHCSSVQAKHLDITAVQYADACNYISKRYFDNDCHKFTKSVHRLLYYSIRSLFGLKAQEAHSVFRTVMARYCAVDAQLYYQVKRYKDKYSKKMFPVNRTIHDLQKPIHFRRPQIMMQRTNDWSWVQVHGKPAVSLSTIYGRIKISYYIPKYFRKYTHAPWKYRSALYIKSGGKRYLYITVSRDVPKLTVPKIRDLVGNDRGIRFLIFSQGDRQVSCVRGLGCRRKRSRFLKQRAHLQHKQTRATKRKLKCISGRENCWMHNINHCTSKALVQRYGKLTVYVLENLRGVKFEAMNSPKKNRYSRATWTFYSLGQKLIYKALLNQSMVLHVNPQFTSQRCPRCGHVLKANRNHGKHIFVCKHCGYTSNDDRIGSLNIRFLGKLQLLGYKRPFIRKNNQVGYHKRHKIKYLSRVRALEISQCPIKRHRSVPAV